ncbi:hypothetical protein OY671_004649 [Metschnikowia pulcherrima]|nr:hypothetical protein OY671_004649 [Metschnikowia pulcherrima]
MDKAHAARYPLDIPHVTAVELPLNVRNTDRAIGMLGGKERIRMAINSQYRPSPIQVSSHAVDDRNLELRLRNDPFHHPVPASSNRREKVLIKVGIPKSSLPADYHDNPGKYSIRELIKMNKEKRGPVHKVEPVSIVNKNYNFRAMADFQMSTKNNEAVQKFNQQVLKSAKFADAKEFYESQLTKNDEHKDPSMYENKDHQLIPPPHFSATKFPYDYKYKKSQFTVAIRGDSGDVKVVMKTDSKKLFTNTVDYHKGVVPHQPLPEIVAKFSWLQRTDLSNEWAERKLYECITQLNKLFTLKPVWLRKSLIDVMPEDLKSAVKEALPYVSYCYKNGPWRFCNVKLGVDPTADRSYWLYQSEYFRSPGPQAKESPREVKKVPLHTLSSSYPESDVEISESLVFTGNKVPSTIIYHLGEIIDPDVQQAIAEAQNAGKFFREAPDSQDGWVTRQMMGTIRGIIRYKLLQLQLEQSIKPEDIARIIATDHTLKDARRDDDDATRLVEENDEDEDDDEDDQGVAQNDDDADEAAQNGAAQFDALVPSVSEEDVINRVKQVDEESAAKLLSLVGLIKQDALNRS